MKLKLSPVIRREKSQYTGEIDYYCHRMKVFVDGTLLGEAHDCETAWVILPRNERLGEQYKVLCTAFPGGGVESLAYGIEACVDGVERVEVDKSSGWWSAFEACEERRATDLRNGDWG